MKRFTPPGDAIPSSGRLKHLKHAIWLYLILLIFEGALRKWVLTDWSEFLLVVRDPVAAFVLFEALRLRIFPHAVSFYASYVIAVIALVLTLLVGHGNLMVALYGVRPFVLHFPAMFVIALVLNRDDLIRMGKFILVVSLAMTALLVIQFYSPQSALVNRGVGGEGTSAGFSGALGYYRPPGTFSFTNGVAQFYSLQIAFLLFFWLHPGHVRRWLLIAATVALAVAIPFSVSRTLTYQCVVTVAFAALVALTRPKLLGRSLQVALAVGLALLIASQTEYFQTAVMVFQTRFELATLSEGGLEGTLVDRYLAGHWEPIVEAGKWPLWGVGLGMGTNVGSVLLTGQAQFLVAEGDWGRLVGEMGPVLGVIVIAMRVGITGMFTVRSWKALLRGEALPWLLLANALTSVPQGSWAQPSALGFSIVAGALVLASLRRPAMSGAQLNLGNSATPRFAAH